jgi:hypothetical protein
MNRLATLSRSRIDTGMVVCGDWNRSTKNESVTACASSESAPGTVLRLTNMFAIGADAVSVTVFVPPATNWPALATPITGPAPAFGLGRWTSSTVAPGALTATMEFSMSPPPPVVGGGIGSDPGPQVGWTAAPSVCARTRSRAS